jgi:hypothetical protein
MPQARYNFNEAAFVLHDEVITFGNLLSHKRKVIIGLFSAFLSEYSHFRSHKDNTKCSCV